MVEFDSVTETAHRCVHSEHTRHCTTNHCHSACSLSKHRRLLAQPGVSPHRRAADMTAQPAHVDTEEHYRPSIASQAKPTQTNRGTVTPQEAPRVRREAISQEDQLEPTRIKDSLNYLQTTMRPRPNPLCYIVMLVSNLGVLLKDLLLYFLSTSTTPVHTKH